MEQPRKAEKRRRFQNLDIAHEVYSAELELQVKNGKKIKYTFFFEKRMDLENKYYSGGRFRK